MGKYFSVILKPWTIFPKLQRRGGIVYLRGTAYLEKAVRRKPENWNYRKALFWRLFETQEFFAAENVLRESERFCLPTRHDVELAELYLLLGRRYLLRSDFDQGKAALRRSLELDPDQFDAWTELGNASYYVGDRAGMESALYSSLAVRERLAKRAGLWQDVEKNCYFMGRWTFSIGHSAILGSFAKLKILGHNQGRENVLVLDPSRVGNKTLLTYLAPHFHVITDLEKVRELESKASLLQDPPGLTYVDGRYEESIRAGIKIEEEWESAGHGPLLKLTEEDARWGGKELEKLGVPSGSWFVTIHVRELGFYGQQGSKHSGLRCAEIQTYESAIEEVTQRGGYVFRLGDPSMTKLRPMTRVIDYAHSPIKSPRMDIFLMASCRFMIGTASGPAAVPDLFGRPILLTNITGAAIIQPHRAEMLLPKTFVWRDGRPIGLAEILKSPLGYADNAKVLDLMGAEVVSNTGEEIRDAVCEMFEREKGENFGDADSLSRCFESLCSSIGVPTLHRLSPSFAKRHLSELL